jgi:hypothetical protein
MLTSIVDPQARNHKTIEDAQGGEWLRAVAIVGWLVIVGALLIWQGVRLLRGPNGPRSRTLFRVLHDGAPRTIRLARPVALARLASVLCGVVLLPSELTADAPSDLPPLITSYAIFIAMVVVLAVRRPVPRPHGFGRQPFGRVVRTIAGGYVAFLAIVLMFHVWCAGA